MNNIIKSMVYELRKSKLMLVLFLVIAATNVLVTVLNISANTFNEATTSAMLSEAKNTTFLFAEFFVIAAVGIIIGSDFKDKVNEGDFILGGSNFGCGSSREHAPIAIKGCGISAVIAESFARIFYRNATNVGVPLLEAPGVSELIEDGEEIEVDMEKGIIKSESGNECEFKKLPPFMLEILESGGLINYLKEKNQK